MRKDTLYVSDLDGTLLGTDSRISSRSSEIISGLSRQGAKITVATARTPATVVPLLANTYTTPPAVVMTGTAYWLRTLDTFRDPHFVPAADVLAALEFCRTHDVHPFVYTMAPDGRSLDVYHAAKVLNKAEESFYLERRGLELKRFHLGTPAPSRAASLGRGHSTSADDSGESTTMLLYAMGDEEKIRPAAEAFRDVTDCSVCCYPDIFNPHVWNFEVFPPGISKAGAVERLCDEEGASRLVVFGDSLNDLPMFEIADIAVAVANALPEVRAAADIIIDPNYTDSVARFIAED
ncbi:MAG: HAD family hydrolase [Muribaculaceae bacterium]|nr:HAD family hydrolase [Muribaculaceae bacterium]